jgi:hypothetical protein
MVLGVLVARCGPKVRREPWAAWPRGVLTATIVVGRRVDLAPAPAGRRLRRAPPLTSESRTRSGAYGAGAIARPPVAQGAETDVQFLTTRLHCLKGQGARDGAAVRRLGLGAQTGGRPAEAHLALRAGGLGVAWADAGPRGRTGARARGSGQAPVARRRRGFVARLRGPGGVPELYGHGGTPEEAVRDILAQADRLGSEEPRPPSHGTGR